MSSDFDNDGVSNYNEVIGPNFTLPFSPDSDQDGLLDGEDPNPNTPDDSRPAVYEIQWQQTDFAAISAVGWQSRSANAPTPNFYRKISATATEQKSDAASGHEYHIGKTMTSERTLREPIRYEPVPSVKKPVYGERAVWSHPTHCWARG